MNQASHFLDGSQLYGTSLRRDRSLRQFSRGKLLLANKSGHGRPYLPPADDPRDRCQVSSPTAACYKSGESSRLGRQRAEPNPTKRATTEHLAEASSV